MAITLVLLCLFQAFSVRASFGLDSHLANFRRAAADPPAACNSWEEIISICKSQTAGFVDLPTVDQAECLCYDGTTWLPNIFDGWVATCASWAETSDVADYTIVDSWAGLCTDAGPISTAPAPSSTLTTPKQTSTPTTSHQNSGSPVTTAPPTTSSVDITNNADCSAVISAVDACSSAGASNDAENVFCLCYDVNTSFDPNPFDNAVATCANYVKTADPTDYSIWTSLEGYCTINGPLSFQSTASPLPTSTVRGQTSSTNGFGGGASLGLPTKSAIQNTNSQQSTSAAVVASTPSTTAAAQTTSVKASGSANIGAQAPPSGGAAGLGVLGTFLVAFGMAFL